MGNVVTPDKSMSYYPQYLQRGGIWCRGSAQPKVKFAVVATTSIFQCRVCQRWTTYTTSPFVNPVLQLSLENGVPVFSFLEKTSVAILGGSLLANIESHGTWPCSRIDQLPSSSHSTILNRLISLLVLKLPLQANYLAKHRQAGCLRRRHLHCGVALQQLFEYFLRYCMLVQRTFLFF